MLQRFICAVVFCAAGPTVSGQQPAPPPPSPSPGMELNVQVTQKSGVPVADLAQTDFTLLDNKQPRQITSFKLVTPAQEPVEVLLVLDEVNAPYEVVVMQRDGVDRYLRSNQGRLPFPTSVAVFTDRGVQMEDAAFSSDGAALAAGLAHFPLAQRQIERGTQFGDFDRLRLSLNALHQIVGMAAAQPGRKIVLFVSPGWPLLAGMARSMDSRMEDQLFKEIVACSTQLRLADVTLYDLDPSAVRLMHETAYYEGFLKGVSKPGQALPGNLALQVLALQSGGSVQQFSADAMPMIKKSLLDLRSWYQIGFDPLPTEAPDAYHQIQIKLDKPGLKAQTRDGYYSNTTVDAQR